MIIPGSFVAIDKIAFEYAGIDYTEHTVGIVVSNICPRKVLNLDTDEPLCEVMITSGDICIFYSQDLTLL